MRDGVLVVVGIRRLREYDEALVDVGGTVVKLFGLVAEFVEGRQENNVELSGLYPKV